VDDAHPPLVPEKIETIKENCHPKLFFIHNLRLMATHESACDIGLAAAYSYLKRLTFAGAYKKSKG